MKSKAFIIAVVFVCLLLAGGGIYLFTSRNKTQETVSPASQGQILPKPTAGPKLLTWNDQAGFTFQYSEGLQIDKHDEDEENYAHIDFTGRENPGGILVMASDTKYKTVADWVKSDKSLTGGQVVDTTLGGKQAKKISFSDNGKMIIGAIDSQILFSFQVTDEGGFWKPIFDQMISSFEFVYPTAAAQKSSGSSGDIIEEEEIIE